MGVLESPMARNSAIVESDKRNGRRHDQKIDVAVIHNIRFYSSENTMENPVFSQINQSCNANRQHADKQDQLVCRLAGLLRPALSYVLSCHNGSSCGKRRKHIDHEDHDRIYQRNGGNGGFSHACRHNRIRHPHCHSQKLFDNQRNNQLPKLFVCKSHFSPSYFRYFPSRFLAAAARRTAEPPRPARLAACGNKNCMERFFYSFLWKPDTMFWP